MIKMSFNWHISVFTQQGERLETTILRDEKI